MVPWYKCNIAGSMSNKQTWKAWRYLNGIFAVYKPPSIQPTDVKHIIQNVLVEDLNKLENCPQKSLVKVAQDISRINENGNKLSAVSVPTCSFTDHVLVRGPSFSNIKVAVVSAGLDEDMSGVMVLAVKRGTKDIDAYQSTPMSKTYIIKGQFGFATDNHNADGKIWQKSTFDHVTEKKFERTIANMQRSHQKVIFSNSGVDIHSHEAYELATQDLVRPFGDNMPPLILDMRCVQFKLPDFELEIECVGESSQYLRKIVHDLAQYLKTCAVTTHVRRTRDGPFTTKHALLRRHWNLPYIAEALQIGWPLVKETVCRTHKGVVLNGVGE